MMQVLQTLRDTHERPIFISSGYRCKDHPVESIKDKPGEHTYGLAVDIICNGQEALKLLRYVQYMGINRIGLHQKGRASSRFIHIGLGNRFDARFPAAIWTY